MQNINNQLRHYHINADILSAFRAANLVNWNEIRISSIHRILYLASILYSFKKGITEISNNIFQDYRFNVSLNGPYDVNIEKSLNFLIKDDYLIKVEGYDTCYLNKSIHLPNLNRIPENHERAEWIQIVVLILNIYTENRIYDFVFRDPQYRKAVKSNTQQGLDTSQNNETVKTLNEFKSEFENSVVQNPLTLSNQQYLELYFEYVFGKILKREQ